jgi:peptidoglycan/LPS O-acetylase OafA/YrhL
MNRLMSCYLDSIRASAALLVAMHHFSRPELSAGMLDFRFGHEAVVLFFVLSGYVIAYITENRERDIKTFLLKRFSRIYSVLPFVILITLSCEFVGRYYGNESIYGEFGGKAEMLKNSALSLVQLNYNWGEHLYIGRNGVLWSLACEWFYYLGFALLFFVKRSIAYAALVLLCCIVGPHVVVLAPCWILGVIARRLTVRLSMTFVAGSCMFLFSSFILAFTIYHFSKMKGVNTFLGQPALNSGKFYLDYIVAFIFALHIFVASFVFDSFEKKHAHTAKVVNFILSFFKYPAGISFTLYCIHEPLFYMVASLIPYERSNPYHLTTVFLSVFVVCAAAGLTIEPLKNKLYKKISSDI